MKIGKRLETLFIGTLKEEKKKEKEKDNQYKLKRPMAIAIGLNNVCISQPLLFTSLDLPLSILLLCMFPVVSTVLIDSLPNILAVCQTSNKVASNILS